MITKIMIEGAFVRSLPSYGLLTPLAVLGAATVVLAQAATMRQYIWMTLFLVVACVLNPVFALAFSKYMFAMVSTLAILLFFFSLELVKPRRVSIASITDRMPGSESL